MNALRAVFVHELRRSLTAGRIVWWALIAVFPVLITMLLRSIPDFARGAPPEQLDTIWSVLFYVLIPSVGCALSVLLMAAPAVAAELEGRSWIYLATRPNGIFWLILGKYLVSVVWASTAAAAGATMAVVLSGTPSAVRIGVSLIGMSCLSAMAYSAIYLLIGAVLPKRAMVFCVMYTFIVEVGLGFIPAIVNRLTVQYRLRSLLVQWVPVDERLAESPAFSQVFNEGSVFAQIFWLFAITAIFLSLALVVAHRKEFTTASEGDL